MKRKRSAAWGMVSSCFMMAMAAGLALQASAALDDRDTRTAEAQAPRYRATLPALTFAPDQPIPLFTLPTPTRTPTPISIGNLVWDDVNMNGQQNGGEPGLAGVTVQLWNPLKNILFDEAVTNENGHYLLVAPYPDSYRIRVIPSDLTDSFSPQNQANGDDSDDSDIFPSGIHEGFSETFTISENFISISTLDAGIIKFRTPTPTRTPTPISVGNLIWHDLNENGLQDSGEPGIAGVTVQLWNPLKNFLLDEAVSNANGQYLLVAPYPDSYRVRVLLPDANARFSPKDQAGGDDGIDSDIHPSGIHAGFSDTFTIPDNYISISTIDVGIIRRLTLQEIPPGMVTLSSGQLPPPPQAVPPAAPPSCQDFRLSSPLDGLPNGRATFYWDPAPTPGLNYQVEILENGALLAVFDGGTATTVGGDISQDAIGGGFVLTVRVNAIQNGVVVCTSEVTLLREAAVNPAQPASTPCGRRGC